MRETVTISLPAPIRRKLDQVAKENHANRSDVVRDALSQYLSIREFKGIRARLVSAAAKKGLFTDDDIFNQVS